MEKNELKDRLQLFVRILIVGWSLNGGSDESVSFAIKKTNEQIRRRSRDIRLFNT